MRILKAKTDKKFEEMAGYLKTQKLKVNEEKTHIMLLKTRQKRKQAKETLTIKAGSEEIKASKTEKLLGIEIESNLGFGKHIDSLVEKLEVGIKAIRAITGIANFKTRKSILNGHAITMSTITM